MKKYRQVEIEKEKRCKPDSVETCYLSAFYIAAKLLLLTPHQCPSRTYLMIYLALHRIEFTWFHYSRTVLAFCCTCPTLTSEVYFFLFFFMVSGLPYPKYLSINKSRFSELQKYKLLFEFLLECKCSFLRSASRMERSV